MMPAYCYRIVAYMEKWGPAGDDIDMIAWW